MRSFLSYQAGVVALSSVLIFEATHASASENAVEVDKGALRIDVAGRQRALIQRIALTTCMIVRRQSFSESAGCFVTEALVRFLFEFRRQRIGAATGVF